MSSISGLATAAALVHAWPPAFVQSVAEDCAASSASKFTAAPIEIPSWQVPALCICASARLQATPFPSALQQHPISSAPHHLFSPSAPLSGSSSGPRLNSEAASSRLGQSMDLNADSVQTLWQPPLVSTAPQHQGFGSNRDIRVGSAMGLGLRMGRGGRILVDLVSSRRQIKTEGLGIQPPSH